jgi:hypothetical protein
MFALLRCVPFAAILLASTIQAHAVNDEIQVYNAEYSTPTDSFSLIFFAKRAAGAKVFWLNSPKPKSTI